MTFLLRENDFLSCIEFHAKYNPKRASYRRPRNASEIWSYLKVGCAQVFKVIR